MFVMCWVHRLTTFLCLDEKCCGPHHSSDTNITRTDGHHWSPLLWPGGGALRNVMFRWLTKGGHKMHCKVVHQDTCYDSGTVCIEHPDRFLHAYSPTMFSYQWSFSDLWKDDEKNWKHSKDELVTSESKTFHVTIVVVAFFKGFNLQNKYDCTTSSTVPKNSAISDGSFEKLRCIAPKSSQHPSEGL